MVSQLADDGGSLEQVGHGPDLHGLAVFTASPTGVITSWSVTATRLFGHSAQEVIGRDVRDVLMTEQEQRDLVGQGLIAVAAGHVWSANFPMCAANGSCQINVHCEPLAGPDSGALVIGRRTFPGEGQHVLSDAANRIGTTLDLDRTASEAATLRSRRSPMPARSSCPSGCWSPTNWRSGRSAPKWWCAARRPDRGPAHDRER